MKKKTSTYFIACLLLGFAVTSYAQNSGIDSHDLLDNILNRFSSTASLWSQTILAYARYLFWSLALISMVWTYGFMALRRADIQEFMAETVRFFVVVGFFYWILDNGPAIASAIIDSMRQLAANASGIEAHISPSSIIDVGFDIVSKAIDNSSIWSPAATIIGLIVAGLILIILALVSINMLITLITAWILIYGGIIVLGFGGGRWTQDIAIQYYKTVLGVALQAFAMTLIVGIGKSFVDQYYAAMTQDILLKEMFVMLVVAILLLFLMNKIPPVLSGMVSGGGFSGGGVGLGAAFGAASLASSAMTQAASSAGLQSAGGLAALQAAFKAASQSTGAELHSSGGLAHASRFAGSFASHLATGTLDAAQEKIGTMKEAFAAKIAETTGGQIADAIHQRIDAPISSTTNDTSTPVEAPAGSFSAGASQDNNISSFAHRHVSGATS